MLIFQFIGKRRFFDTMYVKAHTCILCLRTAFYTTCVVLRVMKEDVVGNDVWSLRL